MSNRRQPAEEQGGNPNKKAKPSEGGDETDHSTLSNASTSVQLPKSTAKSTPALPSSSAPASAQKEALKSTETSNVKTTPPSSSAPPSPKKEVVNFAETGVQLPVGIVTLSGVPSGAIEMTTGNKQQVPVVAMQSHCRGNLDKIKRILNSYILMPSYSRLHNVFTSDPKDFSLKPVGRDTKSPKSWRIGNLAGDKAVSFYVIGKVAHSALSLEGDTKTISIQVIERFWPRITSFLATVVNMDVLLVPVKDGGICFSTFKQGTTDWASSTKKPGRHDNGPDVRSWKVPVPVFDGRENFKLKEYWDLMAVRGGEVGQHSTTLVIFTVGKYLAQSGMRISLNVQSVVAIADRVSSDWTREPDPEWHPSLFDEKPLGVTRVVKYDPQEEQAQANSTDEEEDADEVRIL